MTTTYLFKGYQIISQAKKQILFSAFGYVSHCKHRPSCGQYAMEKLSERGTIWDVMKVAGRVVTCW